MRYNSILRITVERQDLFVSHSCMIPTCNAPVEFPGIYLLLLLVIAICLISSQILNKTSDYATICLYINP